MSMFCRQCEQAAGGKACTVYGACGKDPQVAGLQDSLVQSLVDIGFYGKMLREKGIKDEKADIFVIEALFSTVTNVNFNPLKLEDLVVESGKVKERLKGRLGQEHKRKSVGDAVVNEDIRSLRELLLYGLKGMAAYVDHAYILGKSDDDVNTFIYTVLAALADDTLGAADLIALNMKLGEVNLKCLELLDRAHTEHLGNPVPTKVSLGVKKGPAILVSGHDLYDLEELLKQTENKGINIYTHGEMLASHGYPGLNKYKHLAGHYGTAWQNQQKEFDAFPGAILMTTNCIQKPRDSYRTRIFTAGLVSWPGVEHLSDRKDFSRLIKKAQEAGGFSEDKDGKDILVGFGHNAILGVADKVVGAVKAGQIKHFFLIGGCDGAKPGRNYYTEFAQKVPQDCVILTLACGKFRFNYLDFGDIGGIPRLLDCGQCNDAYSALKVALALADAFGCGVNDLPLSLILSWYEQKAVCILLTLLSLGIKNIRIGPSLPAFISSGVLNVLVEKFGLKPITTAEEDLAAILKPVKVGV